MELRWLILVVGVLAAIFISIGASYVFVTGLAAAEDFEPSCNRDSDCRLSYCDCKCYAKGETPEEKEGIFCGRNCEAEFGISGCSCVDYTCEIIQK